MYYNAQVEHNFIVPVAVVQGEQALNPITDFLKKDLQ